MARFNREVQRSRSLRDRLIDDGSGPQGSEFTYMRMVRESVQRDLSNLLNTRRDILELPPNLPAVNKSIAAYGVPDFSNATLGASADVNRIRRAVEEAIRLFEPRLENVTVTLFPIKENERLLRFRIDAHLRVDQESEPVEFNAALRVSGSTFSVRE